LATDDEIRAKIMKEKEHNDLVENEMYALLMKLRNGEKPDFSNRDPIFEEALENCCNSGYILGIYPSRVASGRLVLDFSGSVEITDEGERFTFYRNPHNRR